MINFFRSLNLIQNICKNKPYFTHYNKICRAYRSRNKSYLKKNKFITDSQTSIGYVNNYDKIAIYKNFGKQLYIVDDYN